MCMTNSSNMLKKNSDYSLQSFSSFRCLVARFVFYAPMILVAVYFDQQTGAPLFAGQNRISDAKTTFSITNGTK